MHSSLKPGDLVRVAVGGDFTLTDRMGFPPVPESKVLLLSAGIGVTPMIGALRWLRQRESKRSSDPNRCVRVGCPRNGNIFRATRMLISSYLAEGFSRGRGRSHTFFTVRASFKGSAVRVPLFCVF